MKKTGILWTGKIYEMKRQYPLIREFEHRMNVVKKELNRDGEKHK